MMNRVHEHREFHSHIIPVQIDEIELIKQRRKLAILRYELAQKMGMKWKKDQAEKEQQTHEAEVRTV